MLCQVTAGGGGNRQHSELTDGMESLVGLFIDRRDVLIKTEFIVCESKIFEAAHLLNGVA